MTSPKVCIFTETYYPVVGGGETQARILADGLVASGFSVIILTRRSDPALKRIEQLGEVTVYRLPPVGRGQLKKWGLLFSSLPRLIHLRHHYDIIFVSGFRIIGISAVLVSKIFGKACVLKADSQGEMSGDFFEAGLARLRMHPSRLPFRIFLNIRNAILKRANAFTAITSDIATELIDIDVDTDAIYMIPNSVDTVRFCPVNEQQKQELRRNLNIPPANTTVIYTGRLVSYKGLPLLLKVWEKIQREHDNVNLLLVGMGGLDIHNCEDQLKEYVIRNKLEKSVRFTGSVQNVPEYLQAADIFAFPTENDAFPSSLIEAMTCSLPVVTTPVGAINTIINDRQNGLIVKPGDFQQLHDALDSLITDHVLAAQLGRAAWQTVQERYSADIVTQQYIDLFCSIDNQRNVLSAEVTH